MALNVESVALLNHGQNVTTMHGTFTVPGSLSNTILVLHLTSASGSNFAASSATYNAGSSQNFTFFGKQNDSATQAWVEIWYLVNPTPGTNADVDVTWAGSCTATMGIALVSGADQSSPWRAAAQGATGSAPTQPSVTVSSATNDIVFAGVVDNENADDTLAVGGSQTVIYNADFPGAAADGAASYLAGAASTVMDWTGVTASAPWAMIGASLVPVGGGGTNAVSSDTPTVGDTQSWNTPQSAIVIPARVVDVLAIDDLAIAALGGSSEIFAVTENRTALVNPQAGDSAGMIEQANAVSAAQTIFSSDGLVLVEPTTAAYTISGESDSGSLTAETASGTLPAVGSETETLAEVANAVTSAASQVVSQEVLIVGETASAALIVTQSQAAAVADAITALLAAVASETAAIGEIPEPSFLVSQYRGSPLAIAALNPHLGGGFTVEPALTGIAGIS